MYERSARPPALPRLQGPAVLKILMVGLGGAGGSILRYLASGYVQQLFDSATFPYGTLVVNVLGCLLIGFLSELAEAHGMFTAETRALLLIGMLGGFTTFSTFGNESMNLLRDGEGTLALMNIGASIMLGLAAVWVGRSAAYLLWR